MSLKERELSSVRTTSKEEVRLSFFTNPGREIVQNGFS